MNANHQTKFRPMPVRQHDMAVKLNTRTSAAGRAVPCLPSFDSEHVLIRHGGAHGVTRPTCPHVAQNRRSDRAFTLTELLVVLTTLGILAVVLLPALAGNQQPGASKVFQCLNNMRQLGLACSLYANDNRDKLVTNSDRNNNPAASSNWIDPAIGGSVPVLDWSTNPSNTNTLYLTIDALILGQRATALIGSYAAKSVTIFVCPADNYLSKAQQGFWSRALSHRIRSCAMNGAMGDGSKWFGFRADGTPNGGHSGRWTTFYGAKKLTDIHKPAPSDCFLILDENPNSNDDATFFTCPADADGTGTSFTELPGSMHNGAAGMVFADGHSAMHIWNGRTTTQPINTSSSTYLQGVSVSGDAASQNDLTWLAQHTPAN